MCLLFVESPSHGWRALLQRLILSTTSLKGDHAVVKAYCGCGRVYSCQLCLGSSRARLFSPLLVDVFHLNPQSEGCQYPSDIPLDYTWSG